MSMNGDGVPLVGQPTIAKPVVLKAVDGSLIVVPQVFVAAINKPIMDELVARTAVAAEELILKALAKCGIVPTQQPAEPEKPADAEPVASTDANESRGD